MFQVALCEDEKIFAETQERPQRHGVSRRNTKGRQKTDIVFVTSRREYAIDGYDVNALHYLVKPVNAAALGRLIQKVYENKYRFGYFILKTGTQNQKIAVNDVVALETVGRKVEITTVDGPLYYSGKLTALLAELPAGYFMRCHQGYAVNIGNSREIDRFEAVAANGKRIPISRPYLKEIQTAFLMNMQA